MQTDPSFNFLFFLAEKLHITIAQVEQMPMVEFVAWGVYFGRKAQMQQLANR